MPHVDKTVNTRAVQSWQATSTAHIYLLFDNYTKAIISSKHFDVLTRRSSIALNKSGQ